MGYTYISDKRCIPRIPHRCRVCGERVEAGEVCRTYRGVESGRGFYTLYFHDECWEFSRDWDYMDWETILPGSLFNRASVRKMVEEARKGRKNSNGGQENRRA